MKTTTSPYKIQKYSHTVNTQPSYKSFNMLPPININSLKEIELEEIFKNAQLRHDIVFDNQIQFRPNLDGERGIRKKQESQIYWSRIQEVIDAGDSKHVLIHNLFKCLFEILESLIPERDNEELTYGMKIDLDIFEIEMFDFREFSKKLSIIIKKHCAPMRDKMVDEMENAFQQGKPVEGFKLLFGLLEIMKLDVANHQIRILRPILVENSIDFERKYFRKLNLNSSKRWFRSNQNSLSSTNTDSESKLRSDNQYVLCHSIISLLSCCKPSSIPVTFNFDFNRLIEFKAKLRELVCLNLCQVLLQQKRSKALNKWNEEIKNNIISLISDDHHNKKWTKNIGLLSLELARHIDEPSLPSQTTITFVTSWLLNNLNPHSPLYTVFEKRISTKLTATLHEKLSLALKSSGSGVGVSSGKPSTNSSDLDEFAEKILVLTKFHWNVFGPFYSSTSVSPSGSRESKTQILQQTTSSSPSINSPETTTTTSTATQAPTDSESTNSSPKNKIAIVNIDEVQSNQCHHQML